MAKLVVFLTKRLKMKLLLFSLMLLLSGCTVSLTLANTHGTATDLVDSTPTTETKTDATLHVPVSAI